MTTWQRLGPLTGLVGAAFILVGSMIAALAYAGAAGQGFSPLNHWVSELGEVGVSSLAAVFNGALIVGGLCFAIFMTTLARLRRSRLAWLYLAIGVIAGIGGAFVGIFPMNEIGPHRLAALTFFNFGWIAVGLASLDLARKPDRRFPAWLPYLGWLTVATFLAFLALYVPALLSTGYETEARPAFSLVIALEWLVLLGIIGWTLVAAIGWFRADRGRTD